MRIDINFQIGNYQSERIIYTRANTYKWKLTDDQTNEATEVEGVAFYGIPETSMLKHLKNDYGDYDYTFKWTSHDGGIITLSEPYGTKIASFKLISWQE